MGFFKDIVTNNGAFILGILGIAAILYSFLIYALTPPLPETNRWIPSIPCVIWLIIGLVLIVFAIIAFVKRVELFPTNERLILGSILVSIFAVLCVDRILKFIGTCISAHHNELFAPSAQPELKIAAINALWTNGLVAAAFFSFSILFWFLIIRGAKS